MGNIQFRNSKILFTGNDKIAMHSDCCCVWKLENCEAAGSFIYVTNDLSAKSPGDVAEIDDNCYELVGLVDGNDETFAASIDAWHADCEDCLDAVGPPDDCPTYPFCIAGCPETFTVTVTNSNTGNGGGTIDGDYTMTLDPLYAVCRWTVEGATSGDGIYDDVWSYLNCGSSGDGTRWCVHTRSNTWGHWTVRSCKDGSSRPNCPPLGAYIWDGHGAGDQSIATP